MFIQSSFKAKDIFLLQVAFILLNIMYLLWLHMCVLPTNCDFVLFPSKTCAIVTN